jgi:hypothetical protein
MSGQLSKHCFQNEINCFSLQRHSGKAPKNQEIFGRLAPSPSNCAQVSAQGLHKLAPVSAQVGMYKSQQGTHFSSPGSNVPSLPGEFLFKT